MATANFWTGSADGVPSNTNNWSLGSILTTHDLIFPRSATVSVDGGTVATNAVQSVLIEDGASINLGSDSAKIQITMSTTTTLERTLRFKGTGNAYLDIDKAAAIHIDDGNTIEVAGVENTALYVNAADAEVYVGIRGTPAEFSDIDIRAGTVYLVNAREGTAAGTGPDIEVRGGTVYSDSQLSRVDQWGGTLYQREGAVTASYGNGGTLYYNTDDTLTTADIGDGHSLDLSQGFGGVTISAINMYSGGTFNDPYGRRAADANFISLQRCNLSDVTINVGDHKKFAPTNI